MTLSKVLKKLPNYIKQNEVIQIQVQWQAVKCMAFGQWTPPSNSPPDLESFRRGPHIAQVACCKTAVLTGRATLPGF